jgi:Tfp pilus assembly protein PilX
MSVPAVSSGLQRGVVLTIALLLLLVLTLLAVANLHGAGNEIALAGNEKFRQQAAAAAEIGIEAALAALPAEPLSSAAASRQIVVDAEDPDSVDRASVQTRYLGDMALVPGFSVERFIGRSFEIRSEGSSRRAAKALRVQGALRIDLAPVARTLPSGAHP